MARRGGPDAFARACVAAARAVAVLLAVFTLALGGGVRSTRRPHHESAVLRAAAQHHAGVVIAIATADAPPEAKRPALGQALDLPRSAARWQIAPPIVAGVCDWIERAPDLHDDREPAALVARGPPSC